MQLRRNLAVATAVFVTVLGACATGSVAPNGTDAGGDATTGCPPCSGSTPKCDTATSACVECLANADCGDAGATCDTTTHTCKAQCLKDSDCTGTAKKCDTAQHVCVVCLTTNDTCPAGTYCAKDANGVTSCQSGCKSDVDCTTASLDAGVSDSGTDGGAASLACCSHQCIDTSSDEKNCGACGTTCTSTQLCCSDSCLESQTSTQNCGACGNVCNPAHVTTAQCNAGACGYDTCTTGYGDCDKDKTNGCEADLTSDVANCGACGKPCNTGEQCVGSQCVTCTTNEIAYNGHCYYLDGSTGNCDTGYSRAAEAVLSSIYTQFIGKNYKHTVSQNCCIWTSDTLENWGMAAHCNSNGPFTSGDPQMGAAGCTAQQNHYTGQLTFCGSN